MDELEFIKLVKENHENVMKIIAQKNEMILQLTEQLKLQRATSQSGFLTHEKGETEEMPRKFKYGQGDIKKRVRNNKKGGTYEWYQIRWLDEFGKRRTTTTRTLDEAYNVLKVNNRRTMKNKLTPPITFGQHINEWYDTFRRRDCCENRNKSNLFQISRIPKSIMDKQLTKVSALEIQQFLNTIPDSSPRVQTKQLIKAALVHAFNNASIKHNIGELLKAELVSPQERQILSRDMEEKFINLLPERYRGYAIGLIYTGCRIGEFMRLNENWQTDIDYTKKKIKIRETKSLRQRDIRRGKTFKYREMPLLPQVAALKFPLPKTKQKTINPNFNKVSKQLGINITPHCLRHTFVSRCNEYGINTSVTQEWVGHVTERMTQHYTHNTKELLEREFEKVRKGLTPKSFNKVQ